MKLKKQYEYIIIGTGFGGSFTAYNLAKAGKEVLMIDRGKNVVRDDSCWDENILHLKDHLYRNPVPFFTDQKKGKIEEVWIDDSTVGGMSTFYGAASFRMREDEFLGGPVPGSAGRDPDSAWPYAYKDIEKYYDQAEKLLGVAGIAGKDPTEPFRKTDYLHAPETKLSTPSATIWKSAKKLGLNPFYLPMAINFSGKYGKNKCISCPTCDHYLCKIEAKNDIPVMIMPYLQKKGVQILENTRALKIYTKGRKAEAVEIIDQSTGKAEIIKAKNVVVSGGALASPHLLLSSGIGNSNDSIVGRYLFRHVNGIACGIFPFKANPENKLQKQIGIHDFYLGDSAKKRNVPEGPWGAIHDVSSLGKGVIKQNSPVGVKTAAGLVYDYLINLICMAEDIPQYNNRIYLSKNRTDKFGVPELIMYHRYHQRDIEARNALYKKAKKILRNAGALMTFTIGVTTVSHAMGTCRMGADRLSSVVNPECKVWDFDNLYVIDASVMPSGGSVNPSLTIAALSLKASERM